MKLQNRAVMFAQADEINANGIGQNAFFNHVAQNLIMRLKRAIGAQSNITKRVDTQGIFRKSFRASVRCD